MYKSGQVQRERMSRDGEAVLLRASGIPLRGIVFGEYNRHMRQERAEISGE